MEIRKDLYYTENHEWVSVEDGEALIGITDYAQSKMGDITFVELPFVDDEFEKEDVFGAVENYKGAEELYAPISGVAIEINEELEAHPELINEAPYENWIVKFSISDETELDELLDNEEYEALISKEE